MVNLMWEQRGSQVARLSFYQDEVSGSAWAYKNCVNISLCPKCQCNVLLLVSSEHALYLVWQAFVTSWQMIQQQTFEDLGPVLCPQIQTQYMTIGSKMDNQTGPYLSSILQNDKYTFSCLARWLYLWDKGNWKIWQDIQHSTLGFCSAPLEHEV